MARRRERTAFRRHGIDNLLQQNLVSRPANFADETSDAFEAAAARSRWRRAWRAGRSAAKPAAIAFNSDRIGAVSGRCIAVAAFIPLRSASAYGEMPDIRIPAREYRHANTGTVAENIRHICVRFR